MHQLVYYFTHCPFPHFTLSLIQTISNSVTRKTKLIQRHQNKINTNTSKQTIAFQHVLLDFDVFLKHQHVG